MSASRPLLSSSRSRLVRPRGTSCRVRRAHQAAGHRAPLPRSRAGDVLRRPGGREMGLGPSSPSSAGPFRRVGVALNCSTTATSTNRCAVPADGPPAIVSPSPHSSSGCCWGSSRPWCWPSGSTLAVRRALGAANAFYVLVYTMVLEATDHPEHRLGRAGQMLPGTDRVDRGDQRAVVGAGRLFAVSSSGPAARTGARAALPRDYANVDVPMLPVVASAVVGRQIVLDWVMVDVAAAVAGGVTGCSTPSLPASWARFFLVRPPDVGSAPRHRGPERDPADELFHPSNLYLSVALRGRRA